MFYTIELFFEAVQPFIEGLNAWIRKTDLEHIVADHIGYLCESRGEFESIRSSLENICPFFYQSTVSGRHIAIFKLPKPIPTLLGDIWFLELSDRKPNRTHTQGFDHIELFPIADCSLEEVISFAKQSRGVEFKETVRPHHTTYDFTLPSGFTVRLERKPLIEKIKRDEMK